MKDSFSEKVRTSLTLPDFLLSNSFLEENLCPHLFTLSMKVPAETEWRHPLERRAVLVISTVVRSSVVLPPENKRMILARVLTVVVTLSVGGVGEYMAWLERQNAEREERSRVISEAGELRASLESELNAALHLTQGMIAYVATRSNLEPEVIEPMLKTLYEYGRHVRNIGLAPGNRLIYIYPLEGNEKALGLYYPDLKEQGPRSNALSASASRGLPARDN
jgi:hypothetical protein